MKDGTGKLEHKKCTSVCDAFWIYTRTRLMQTFEPPKTPLYTSQEPPEVNGRVSISRSSGGRMDDAENTPLVPPILLSARRHWREV